MAGFSVCTKLLIFLISSIEIFSMFSQGMPLLAAIISCYALVSCVRSAIPTNYNFFQLVSLGQLDLLLHVTLVVKGNRSSNSSTLSASTLRLTLLN